MGPADSPRISRVLGYSGVHWASVGFRVPGCHRLWLRFPSYSANLFLAVSWILLPHSCRNTSGLGCSAFARHYWRNHCYFLFLRVLRCFSSPRWLTAWRYGHCWPGCPIRIFTGLGLFAPYRNFSQLITSFFASESLGILHAPLLIIYPGSPVIVASKKEGACKINKSSSRSYRPCSYHCPSECSPPSFFLPVFYFSFTHPINSFVSSLFPIVTLFRKKKNR